MKTILSIVILVLLGKYSNAQQYQSMDSMLKNAKSEQKNVMIYFSGSDWCAPCIRFKKNYIEQSEFQEFALNNLIIYNADFPRKKSNQLEKDIIAFNEKLADTYNTVGAFPKIVLLDSSGKIIKEWEKLPSESLQEFIAYLK